MKLYRNRGRITDLLKGSLFAALIAGALVVSGSSLALRETPPSVSTTKPSDEQKAKADETVEKEDTAIKICLSPGHPSEPGDKLFEAVINRKVAFYLQDFLRKKGFDTFIVTNDLTKQEMFSPGFRNESKLVQSALEVMTPEEKAHACNEWGADYLISIHHNHAFDKSENHTLVLYGGDEDFNPRFPGCEKWAELTSERLFKVMKVNDHKAENEMDALGFHLMILKEADVPGILTEASFFSNRAEKRRLGNNAYLKKEAKAIFKAFVEYLRQFTR